MGGFLEDLSGPEAGAALLDATVLLPIGAVEQHGPHLPLSVDHVIADSVARAVVHRLGEGVWVLPTLPISKSNEHAWSAGTMWLSNETMHRVLDDIGRCVAKAGASRLVFLNAHGGNTTMLATACRELRLAHGLMTFVVHPFSPPAFASGAVGDLTGAATHELGMGIHGGHDETSLMLHLRPELVDMASAVRNVPEHLADNTHVRFGGSVSFGWLSNDFGTSGHIGDPTGATAEYGALLFDQAVDSLVDQLREIQVFTFDE